MNQFRTESEIRDSIDFYDQYNFPTERVSMADYEINGGHGANGLLAFSAQYIAKLSDLTSIQFEKFCWNLGWNLRIKWNVSCCREICQNSNLECAQLRFLKEQNGQTLSDHPNGHLDS